jgi:hypothetical protein
VCIAGMLAQYLVLLLGIRTGGYAVDDDGEERCACFVAGVDAGFEMFGGFAGFRMEGFG